MKGTIKRVVVDRGFGFIVPEGGGEDLFFHVTACVDGLEFDETLTERRVLFDATTDHRTGKQRAVNVRAA